MASTRCVANWLSLALIVPASAPVTAQQSQIRDLGRAESVFAEPFSNLVGLRELSDGRFIVADRLEQHVSVMDFDAGTLQRLGREGQGPGEYQTPLRLFPLTEDRTLLVDMGNMRVAFMSPTGEIGKTIPMMGDGSVRIPSASDEVGRLYLAQDGFVIRSGGGASVSGSSEQDSTPVVRWDPEAERTDTVAFLSPRPQGAPVQISPGRSGGFSFSGLAQQPFTPTDAWAVTPDGRVAVARAGTYRLDWYGGGQMTPGPTISFDPVRITKAEKEAWAERQSQRTMTFRTSGSGSGGRGVGGGTLTAPKPDIDDIEFPETMPPFATGAVSYAAPFAEVWVRRSQPSTETRPLYDIFDGRGDRVGQVRLPENRRVVGFGTGYVYAVVADEDDLQWLERYSYNGTT